MHETQPPSQLTVSTITRSVTQSGHIYSVFSMSEMYVLGVEIWFQLEKLFFSIQDIQRLQPVQQCGWCNIGEQLVQSCYCSLPCFHFIYLQGPDCEIVFELFWNKIKSTQLFLHQSTLGQTYLAVFMIMCLFAISLSVVWLLWSIVPPGCKLSDLLMDHRLALWPCKLPKQFFFPVKSQSQQGPGTQVYRPHFFNILLLNICHIDPCQETVFLIYLFLIFFLCSVSQSGSIPASSTTTSALDPERRMLTVGMANMVLSLLSSAWFPLDLSAHQDALLLCGNLLAGG